MLELINSRRRRNTHSNYFLKEKKIRSKNKFQSTQTFNLCKRFSLLPQSFPFLFSFIFWTKAKPETVWFTELAPAVEK